MTRPSGEHGPYRVAAGYRGFCPECGKTAFATRKTAKQYARGRYPGAGLRAYPCPYLSGCWHVGHLAPEVACGDVAKHLFYGPGGIGQHRQRCGTRRDPKDRL